MRVVKHHFHGPGPRLADTRALGDIVPQENFGRRIRIVDEAAGDNHTLGFIHNLVPDRRLPTSCLWISMISPLIWSAIFKAGILVFL